jgi:ABC-type multidrug transport system ATPase subunit
MMGMVINLVLLHQASTKYNIAYLDEIDAGLDHRNRFEFVDALYKTIPLLNIEQLFMISHSMETDTSSVDIIKLKGYEDFEDTVQMGNVIFDYNEL